MGTNEENMRERNFFLTKMWMQVKKYYFYAIGQAPMMEHSCRILVVTILSLITLQSVSRLSPAVIWECRLVSLSTWMGWWTHVWVPAVSSGTSVANCLEARPPTLGWWRWREEDPATGQCAAVCGVCIRRSCKFCNHSIACCMRAWEWGYIVTHSGKSSLSNAVGLLNL